MRLPLISNPYQRRMEMKGTTLTQLIYATLLLVVPSCSSSGSSEDINGPSAIIMSDENNLNYIISTQTGMMISDQPFQLQGELSEVSDDVFWVKRNGEYWLHSCKSPSNTLLSVPFRMVTKFAAERAAVSDGVSPIRIINTNGEIIKELPDDIIEVYPFSSEGLAAFRDGDSNLCGYIDTEGNVKIEPQFDYCESFSEGYALVHDGDASEVTSYLIDKKGNRIEKNKGVNITFYTNHVSSGVIPICDCFPDEGEDLSPIVQLTYIKPDGEKVLTVDMSSVPDDNTTIGAIDGCVVYYGINGKCGVKSLEGKLILQCQYDAIQIVSSKTFIVRRNYETAVIGAGDKIIDGYYSYPTCFYPIGHDRYVKKSPDPNSNREQIVAGPGGDPLVLKANSYWIFRGDGKILSNGYTYWSNKQQLLNYEPVCYVNTSNIFAPVMTQINPDKVFGFGPLSNLVDVASRFEWNAENRSNFYGCVKEYNFELPDGSYQNVKMMFSDEMLRPLTHKETRGSGWMSYEEEVIDGYEFNPDSRLVSFIVDFKNMNGAQPEDVLPILNKALADNGFKHVYTEGSGKHRAYVMRLENENNEVEVKSSNKGDHVSLEISIPRQK